MLKATGQLWNFYLSQLATVVSGVTLYLGHHIDRMDAVLVGMGMAFAVLVTAALGIRCPKCGSKWFWHAISTQNAGSWYWWLLQETKCPQCEHDFARG